MPIVAVIALTLGFWVIYWFVRMGGIEHFRAKSAQRKEDAQRAEARTLERTATLRAVDDARDAAAVLMLRITRGGDPTAAQVGLIEQTPRTVFDFEQELIERMAQARFVAATADSFDQAGRIFAPMLKQRLNAVEKHHLVTMLEEVAQLDGPTPAQAEAIAAFSERIGLAPAPAARC